MKITFLMAIEDRIWNMRKAAEQLEKTHPQLIEADYYSVWDLSVHTEKIEDLKKSAASADLVFIYFHGGANSLPDFHLLW